MGTQVRREGKVRVQEWCAAFLLQQSEIGRLDADDRDKSLADNVAPSRKTVRIYQYPAKGTISIHHRAESLHGT